MKSWKAKSYEAPALSANQSPRAAPSLEHEEGCVGRHDLVLDGVVGDFLAQLRVVARRAQAHAGAQGFVVRARPQARQKLVVRLVERDFERNRAVDLAVSGIRAEHDRT